MIFEIRVLVDITIKYIKLYNKIYLKFLFGTIKIDKLINKTWQCVIMKMRFC